MTTSLEYHSYNLLSTLPNGSFTRHGGVSESIFQSLNVSEHVGDYLPHVVKNRQKIAESLNIPTFTYAHQCHGNTVKIASRKEIFSCDALITQERGLGLLVQHADCQAALFYDPMHQGIGAAHVGWRGNVNQMYAAIVQAMEKAFGSKPQDLLVGISPSLGPNYGEFQNYKKEFPQTFWDFQVRPYYFDLWEISKWQLKQAGVLEHHIECSQKCTYTDSEKYFSYRREKVTGRLGSMIALP